MAFSLTGEKLRQKTGVFVRQPVTSGLGDEEEENEKKKEEEEEEQCFLWLRRGA